MRRRDKAAIVTHLFFSSSGVHRERVFIKSCGAPSSVHTSRSPPLFLWNDTACTDSTSVGSSRCDPGTSTTGSHPRARGRGSFWCRTHGLLPVIPAPSTCVTDAQREKSSGAESRPGRRGAFQGGWTRDVPRATGLHGDERHLSGGFVDEPWTKRWRSADARGRRPVDGCTQGLDEDGKHCHG